MRKIIYVFAFMFFAVNVFGQYEKVTEDFTALSFIGGLIVTITTICIWVIAFRLKKLIYKQDLLIKIHTLSGISAGTIPTRTCVRCGDKHTPVIMKNPEICPHCSITYSPDRVIVKSNSGIVSQSKEFYVKHKDEYELLWEHKD